MKPTTLADDILTRLKDGTKAKSDTELAHMIGVSQQSISSARSKEKVPDSWIHTAAERFTLSADWLLFGDGNMYRNEATQRSEEEAQTQQTQRIGVELVLTNAGMQARIKILEEELAAAKEGEKAAMAEALKAYKLATEAMRPETNVVQETTPSVPQNVKNQGTKQGQESKHDTQQK